MEAAPENEAKRNRCGNFPQHLRMNQPTDDKLVVSFLATRLSVMPGPVAFRPHLTMGLALSVWKMHREAHFHYLFIKISQKTR